MGAPFIRFAQPIKELIFYKYIAQAHQHQAKMKTGKKPFRLAGPPA